MVSEKINSICSHKINLVNISDTDKKVINRINIDHYNADWQDY